MPLSAFATAASPLPFPPATPDRNGPSEAESTSLDAQPLPGTGAAEEAPSSSEPRVPVSARRMLTDLSRAAEAGVPCPSNFALMESLDLASPDGVRKAMEALRTAGLIIVETEGQRRRVTIRATGARTDWSRGRAHPRAGAAFVGGWENGQDAILLRLAREGLDLATMATRLGRTPSSVRHRLRRLRATGAEAGPARDSGPLPRPESKPDRASAAAPLPPVQTHIVTTADRPETERAQIAAFLAAGKARKLPPAYAGEVRGGCCLSGIAPISPLARRLVLAMDDCFRTPGDLSARGRLDPLLVPELLDEARDAGLAVQMRVHGRTRFARAQGAVAALKAMGVGRMTDPQSN